VISGGWWLAGDRDKAVRRQVPPFPEEENQK
jgi:hypothetical protein